MTQEASPATLRNGDVPPVLDVAPLETPVTVVGDVHLTPEAPQVTQRFVAFLDDVARRGGTLILLGDIFDWWIGRQQASRQPFATAILERMAAVAQAGVRLCFIPGNRDYAFDGADGLCIDVWPDVVRTRWGDRTVVLSHGDLLCSGDHTYQRVRRFLRSRIGRAGLRVLPYGFATWIAQRFRNLSSQVTRRSRPAKLGIDYQLARTWLDGYNADVLVVGHVHTGLHHELPGSPQRDVYVLRDWAQQGNAVVFNGEGIAMRAVPGGW